MFILLICNICYTLLHYMYVVVFVANSEFLSIFSMDIQKTFDEIGANLTEPEVPFKSSAVVRFKLKINETVKFHWNSLNLIQNFSNIYDKFLTMELSSSIVFISISLFTIYAVSTCRQVENGTKSNSFLIFSSLSAN